MGQYSSATAWQSPTVDLRAVYKRIHDTIPWPEPIPSSDQVTFRWKRRVTRVLGSCYPYKKTITINPIYQDGRLYSEITDLMTHEAGHFIWQGHPFAFKRFLRSIGIAPHYISSSSPSSTAFQAVWAEQSLLPSIWKCPACGATRASTGNHLDVCCGRCAGAWDPQLRFPFAFHDSRNGHQASQASPVNWSDADAGGR